ncbi:Holliday junction DNA helicase subunit RuvA [Alicyclobacillus sacchari]|uniref:Holliday junction branch migration complex subunit RuvA n=1 Tax=Alicyclobacillus sacchari TaxID=392010 RepID=A0A4R8LTM1_9BACL|nr:Holliday junction branch migration protein RuvA [Alicyclobacillus sacchari]TDY51063.1 Holliday junction DNA helicase subunit RuvA [Alicyclobacillus sacchari]GMA56288.1 Holliday junction ATP-dependent DNA helicase RuvA [Alicyclobacillus sacchari]
MIAFLRGLVVSHGAGYLDLDVRDVGYRVHVADGAMAQYPVGAQAFLYTYQHVREDGIVLYGFATAEERTLFERLLVVSGIGPRLALHITGAASVPSLVAAVQSEDTNYLCTLPGIGKKTAQRMVLDLKDKLDDLALAWPMATEHTSLPAKDRTDDVIAALVALGYRPREAQQAIAAIHPEPDEPVEDVVRAALAWLYAQQGSRA